MKMDTSENSLKPRSKTRKERVPRSKAQYFGFAAAQSFVNDENQGREARSTYLSLKTDPNRIRSRRSDVIRYWRERTAINRSQIWSTTDFGFKEKCIFDDETM
uniref:Uncharacterized protein n=1 Tax=Panagrellus redivivus TaxID=6233 RepID=A0A7E4V4R0_PANRE